MKSISHIKHENPANRIWKGLDESTIAVLKTAHSANTVRAYRADWQKFEDWGGSIPASPEQVCNFMVSVVESGQKVASVVRCLYAISHIHKAAGFENPVANELVKQTRRGLRKIYGTPPKQSEPIELELVRRICGEIGSETLEDVRDRALITVAFFGAFRRSEIVSLQTEQLHWSAPGLEIQLLRSKANKFGECEIKPLVAASDPLICPLQNLKHWLAISGIESGPVFPRVLNNGRLGTSGLSAQAFYILLKKRAAAAGTDPVRVTPHGLRAGFVTTAYKRGRDRYQIKMVTGHKSDAVLDSYIRVADRFEHCAGKLD